MTITPEFMVQRWTDPKSRPLFKGSLIDETGCKCAQGDVLACSGWTDEQLRAMTQDSADSEVAKILGISRAHAVLLRQVNDAKDGCPQEVLSNPEKVLGDQADKVLSFWLRLDGLTSEQWDAARAAAWDAAWAAAIYDLIGHYGYTKEHSKLLTKPFISVFGEIVEVDFNCETINQKN